MDHAEGRANKALPDPKATLANPAHPVLRENEDRPALKVFEVLLASRVSLD